jgi:RNA polymerase sigma factor (sigma-70 family)
MSPDARRKAAIALVASHGAALRRTARRHSLCAADAEDAYQRALLVALHKAPEIETSALARWMHAVTRNEARAVRRERARLMGGQPPHLHAGPDPHDRAERREHVATTARALATLKPQERRALALLAAGLSYAEIGELCGWTHTKVNRCLAEGRAALRERVALLEGA